MATLLLRRVPLYRGAVATFWRRGTDKTREDQFCGKVIAVTETEITVEDMSGFTRDLITREWTWNLELS